MPSNLTKLLQALKAGFPSLSHLWELFFKADSHLSTSLVKWSQVFWPQHLAGEPIIALLVSSALGGRAMRWPPTGVITLTRG